MRREDAHPRIPHMQTAEVPVEQQEHRALALVAHVKAHPIDGDELRRLGRVLVLEIGVVEQTRIVRRRRVGRLRGQHAKKQAGGQSRQPAASPNTPPGRTHYLTQNL
jgi:hypothetical protein